MSKEKLSVRVFGELHEDVYKKRFMASIKPSQKLSLLGNQYNDYKTLRVKDLPEGENDASYRYNAANHYDLRDLMANNFPVFQSYEADLVEAINTLIDKGYEDSLLYTILLDMHTRVLEVQDKFLELYNK